VHYFVQIPILDIIKKKQKILLLNFKQTFVVPLGHSDLSYHHFLFNVFNVPSSLISSTAILIASLK
jgi:hypothetical protein